MNILTFSVLILVPNLSGALKSDWIDPHDMNTNARQKLQRSVSENIIKSEGRDTDSNTIPTVEEGTTVLFLKRALNLILSSADAERNDPNLYAGSYKINTDDHKFLSDFVNKKYVSADDIRKLDTVLSDVFARSQPSIFSFDISNEEIFSTLFHNNSLIILAISVFSLITFFLLKSNYGFFYILSYFIFLVLIVDFAERYRFLFKEAEEHNLNLMYSKDCDISKMGWGDYLKFILSPKDCERKIVTPLEVALNQVKYIIIIPLESFGIGMGKFGKELWTNLPFPWNILIFPIMLMFIIGVAFFFTIAIRDSPFKVNILHLFTLEFGNRNSKENRITEKTLDKLLDATSHRRLVEDTKSSPEKTNNKKERNWKTKSPKRKDKGNKVEELEADYVICGSSHGKKVSSEGGNKKLMKCDETGGRGDKKRNSGDSED